MQWDSPEWRKLRNEKLREWFLDNKAAVECFLWITTIYETWDDLIDQDTEMTPGQIHEAFIGALVELPRNAFYYQWRPMIEPLILSNINAWLDSEEFVKRNDETWRMAAFFLRNEGAGLIPMIAYCVGGFAHMRKISIEAREFLAHETYEEWEHRHESI